jgi:hypothetical protein
MCTARPTNPRFHSVTSYSCHRLAAIIAETCQGDVSPSYGMRSSYAPFDSLARVSVTCTASKDLGCYSNFRNGHE